MHDVQQLDKVTDHLARGQVGVGAHAAEFDFEEFDEIGIGHRAVVGEVPGVDLSELLYENEEPASVTVQS